MPGERSVAVTCAPCNAKNTDDSPSPHPMSSSRLPRRSPIRRRINRFSNAVGASNASRTGRAFRSTDAAHWSWKTDSRSRALSFIVRSKVDLLGDDVERPTFHFLEYFGHILAEHADGNQDPAADQAEQYHQGSPAGHGVLKHQGVDHRVDAIADAEHRDENPQHQAHTQRHG